MGGQLPGWAIALIVVLSIFIFVESAFIVISCIWRRYRKSGRQSYSSDMDETLESSDLSDRMQASPIIESCDNHNLPQQEVEQRNDDSASPNIYRLQCPVVKEVPAVVLPAAAARQVAEINSCIISDLEDEGESGCIHFTQNVVHLGSSDDSGGESSGSSAVKKPASSSFRQLAKKMSMKSLRDLPRIPSLMSGMHLVRRLLRVDDLAEPKTGATSSQTSILSRCSSNLSQVFDDIRISSKTREKARKDAYKRRTQQQQVTPDVLLPSMEEADAHVSSIADVKESSISVVFEVAEFSSMETEREKAIRSDDDDYDDDDGSSAAVSNPLQLSSTALPLDEKADAFSPIKNGSGTLMELAIPLSVESDFSPRRRRSFDRQVLREGSMRSQRSAVVSFSGEFVVM